MFLADLSRALKRPHDIDFMGISSYGAGTQQQRGGANYHGFESTHYGSQCVNCGRYY